MLVPLACFYESALAAALHPKFLSIHQPGGLGDVTVTWLDCCTQATAAVARASGLVQILSRPLNADRDFVISKKAFVPVNAL